MSVDKLDRYWKLTKQLDTINSILFGGSTIAESFSFNPLGTKQGLFEAYINIYKQEIYQKIFILQEAYRKNNIIMAYIKQRTHFRQVNTLQREYASGIQSIITGHPDSSVLNKINSTVLNKLKIEGYDFVDIIESIEDENEETAKDSLTREVIINNVKKIIFEIYLNNEKLYRISPREFEKVIAELLYNNGFEVELTKQTRDGGYDIMALKRIDNLSPVKYLVECKRYNPMRKVGVEIIRSFKEVIQTEQANKGLIVTTSYFSSDAIKKQQETPYLLDYKDKDDLMDWVKEYFNSNKKKR